MWNKYILFKYRGINHVLFPYLSTTLKQKYIAANEYSQYLCLSVCCVQVYSEGLWLNTCCWPIDCWYHLQFITMQSDRIRSISKLVFANITNATSNERYTVEKLTKTKMNDRVENRDWWKCQVNTLLYNIPCE